jgi:cytochrome c oxidase subunit 4
MSAEATAEKTHDAHDHGHGHGQGGDHVPHVLPLKTYFATWGALIVLTCLTVAVSYVNFGPGNLIIAMLIATLKATTVAAMFMHLAFDHKFHAVIIASSVVFLGIFIGFTMFDTETRGRTDSMEHERAADIHNPFAGTTDDAEIRAKWGPPAGPKNEHEPHH